MIPPNQMETEQGLDAKTSSTNASGSRNFARIRSRGLGIVAACAAAALVWLGFGSEYYFNSPAPADRVTPAMQPYERVLAEDPLASGTSLIVEWRRGNGTLHQAVVDRAALKTFILNRIETFERERAVLHETAARYLRYRLDPVFDRMKRRVKTYTTWMYGWAASYVKAYMLVGRGIWKSLGMLAEGNTETLATDLEADLTNFVMAEFRETVLKSEESDAEIRLAWDDTIVFIGSEWTRLRVEAKQAFREFLIRQDVHSQIINQAAVTSRQYDALRGRSRIGLDSAERPPRPDLFSGSPTGNALGEELVVDGIIARSVRPWLSRVVGITLQSTAAGTAAAAGGVALPVAGPGIGLVIGVTTFLAYHWAFDFIVNEVDEGLNRKGIESSLKAAIDSGRFSLNRTLAGELETRIDAAFDAAGTLNKDQVSLGVGLIVRVRKPVRL